MKRNWLLFFGLHLFNSLVAMESSDSSKEEQELQQVLQRKSKNERIARPLLNMAAHYFCIKKYYSTAVGSVWAHNQSTLLATMSEGKTNIVNASPFLAQLTPENTTDYPHNLEVGNWVLPVPGLPIIGSYKNQLLKMAWSPDNKELAGLETDCSTIIILSLHESQAETTQDSQNIIWKTKTLFQNKEINALIWSPDTKYVVTVTVDNIICFWRVDAATIEHVINIKEFDTQFKLPNKTIEKTAKTLSMTYHPHGNYLATCEYENTVVKIWDLNFLTSPGKQPQLTAVLVENNYIKASAWSPDGKYLALHLNEDEKYRKPCSISIWNVQDPKKTFPLYTLQTDLMMRNGDIAWNKEGTILSLINASEHTWRLFHRDVMDWLLTDQQKGITTEQKKFLTKILKKSEPLLIYDGSPINGTLFDGLPQKLQDALIRHCKVSVEMEQNKYKKPVTKQSKQVIMASNGFRPDNLIR